MEYRSCFACTFEHEGTGPSMACNSDRLYLLSRSSSANNKKQLAPVLAESLCSYRLDGYCVRYVVCAVNCFAAKLTSFVLGPLRLERRVGLSCLLHGIGSFLVRFRGSPMHAHKHQQHCMHTRETQFKFQSKPAPQSSTSECVAQTCQDSPLRDCGGHEALTIPNARNQQVSLLC